MSGVRGLRAQALARLLRPLLEPLPDNFALLKRNLRQFEGRSVSLHNFAVGDPSLTHFYLGRNNCGEACFYDIGEQSTATVEVETRAPEVLPKAQIVKIDTEGSEVDILSRVSFRDKSANDRLAAAGLRARRQ